ncbi:MAG: MoaD/ThiS family protein [Acidimicrobiia bacterium]
MARLRLFANLREAAGASEVEAAGATVGEVLANASRAFGEDFAAGLRHARLWVNGQPAEEDSPVGDGDEVAIIPPVSGGATAIRSAAGLQAAVVAVLVGAIVVVNLRSPELLVGALVAVGGLWVWDVSVEAGRQSLFLDRWPMLGAVVVGGIAPYRFGLAGLGVVVALVLMLTLLWGLARYRARSLPMLAGTFAAGFVVAAAIGSLVAMRLGEEGTDRVNAFILIVGLAGLAGWAAARFPVVPYLDPLTAASLAAVLAGGVGGAIWGFPVVTMVVVGVTMSLALIAGRAFGSVLRTGAVYLVEPLGGALAALDGPVMAGALFGPVLALLS